MVVSPERAHLLASGEAQWAQGSGGGVRSWAFHGIGKVHAVAEGGVKTRCGRIIPRTSQLVYPASGDARCRLCAARTSAT